MANNVKKVNGIAIASIGKINGQNDSDLAKLNGEEFTGVLPFMTVTSPSATATSGDYKIYTFNSSSNFVVGALGSSDSNNEVDILAVAGGGGGGGCTAADGGGGGG